MNAVFEATREVCEFLAAQGWRFCVIGGLAVQRWGEPRTTLDADITLLADWGEEERYVRAVLARFAPRVPNGHAFALEHRVLLVAATNGRPVDVALGALPFEVAMVQRSVPIEFAPGLILPCCTAEDLFVLKAFASRPRDWLDVESIAVRMTTLDRRRILADLTELCELKEAPEIVDRARQLLEKHR
ncbi:nucleotidyl transferase AbiEii/AbiGii toxin family protein [Candidatus Fermentibacteria bacterium]|nr:nucleotidyl transferase AbiEii/AbiGii toxin family protein [Candidatus Fermentibacteria bacterium]